MLQNEAKKGLIVLMHGDMQVSTRNLAREIGCKHIELAEQNQATKWTGFLFGGTGPFGIKTPLPVYVEESIWSLDYLYINGGKRGFQIKIKPEMLKCLNPVTVHVATEI